MWPWSAAGRRRHPPVTAPPLAAPSRPRGQWRELPALQRTLDGDLLVNPPERMQAALASWRDPRFLAPLGHLVGPGEPAGLIAAEPERSGYGEFDVLLPARPSERPSDEPSGGP